MPYREGERFFFTKNTGLQNQSVLYTAPKLPGEPKMLLDPNTLSKDGTTALTGTDVTQDGKLLAYGLAMAGSDWQEWSVREIESGKDREDVIKWVKFSSASWNRDGSGFFYSRYDEPAADQLKAANYFHKLYFHRLGTPQSEDQARLRADGPQGMALRRQSHGGRRLPHHHGFGGDRIEESRLLTRRSRVMKNRSSNC